MSVPNPTCSVVIPAYNVERYVAEALESVLAQTYQDVEIVVVNDGSTDGTAGVIDRYRDRVVYVEQANRGLAGARNAGLAVASGGLIALLDADDVWLPERLERCAALFAERPEVGFLTTDAWLLDDEIPTQKLFYGDFLPREFPEDTLLARMIQDNVFFVSVLARRELYDRHGSFDESLRRSEDYDMWLRFLGGGERAACIMEPLAYYRRRSESLSADAAAQSAAHIDVLEKQLHQLAPLVGKGFGSPAWDVALQCTGRGDARAASRFFLLAARDPDLPMASRGRALRRAAITSILGLRGGRRRIAERRPT
jgi:glycosyltransferase involved in cell wall biosynthesis